MRWLQKWRKRCPSFVVLMLSARLKLFQPFHKFFLDIAQKLCVILRFETEMAYQKEQIVYGYKLQTKNSVEDSYQSFHRQGVILTITLYFLLDRFHQFLSIWEICEKRHIVRKQEQSEILRMSIDTCLLFQMSWYFEYFIHDFIKSIPSFCKLLLLR